MAEVVFTRVRGIERVEQIRHSATVRGRATLVPRSQLRDPGCISFVRTLRDPADSGLEFILDVAVRNTIAAPTTFAANTTGGIGFWDLDNGDFVRWLVPDVPFAWDDIGNIEFGPDDDLYVALSLDNTPLGVARLDPDTGEGALFSAGMLGSFHWNVTTGSWWAFSSSYGETSSNYQVALREFDVAGTQVGGTHVDPAGNARSGVVAITITADGAIWGLFHLGVGFSPIGIWRFDPVTDTWATYQLNLDNWDLYLRDLVPIPYGPEPGVIVHAQGQSDGEGIIEFERGVVVWPDGSYEDYDCFDIVDASPDPADPDDPIDEIPFSGPSAPTKGYARIVATRWFSPYYLRLDSLVPRNPNNARRGRQTVHRGQRIAP